MIAFVLCLGIWNENVFSQNTGTKPEDQQVQPDLSWLNQKSGSRPKYVWENREDYIYHEMYYKDSLTLTAPEIFPIMRCAWIFNRSMKWVRNAEGPIIAYSEGRDLPLTGVNQVSGWYSDPDNVIRNSGKAIVFVKNNSKRQRDCAVLPSFQFHLSQHPIVEISVSESSEDWQFVLSMKGRSGPPFICSGWQSGSKTMRFDIARALKNKGYDLNYAELHMAIGTWNSDPQKHATIKFEAKLISQPAIVGSLPVIRTVNDSREGIPISAIVTGLDSFSGKMFANIEGKRIPLSREGQIWKATVNGLAVGSYSVLFDTDSSHIASSTTFIRITDGEYWKHNKEFNSLHRGNSSKSTLTGSFQGTLFFKDVGLSSEQLVNSQSQWDNWNRNEAPGEHLLYWESLTRPELNNRFAYLSKNGWDIVHLHSHYGIWERFDASGNLAPHGIEQFACYVDEASKNGISVQVTLSSYPYSNNTTKWDDGTTPYKQTIEKGFKNEDWFNPQNEPFRSIYHQYIKDFVNTFRDETAIFSFSSSGEGDWKNGVPRFQDTKEVIKSIDSSHIIVSEPFFSYNQQKKYPSEVAKGFTSDLVGSRNYATGNHFNPEEEMSIYLHLQQIVPSGYIAEGSFPSSNLYTKIKAVGIKNDGSSNTWVGTTEYRYNVRDWIYLGLAKRMPLIVTWDEVFTEDEHLVANEVSKRVDWGRPIEIPSVSILLTDTNYINSRQKLGIFEKIFSKLSVNYRFIENTKDANPGDWVIDGGQPFDSTKFSKLSNLPGNIQKKVPFNLSKNYSSQFSISKDRKTMTAYLFNKSHYEFKEYYLASTIHRLPLPALFELTLTNLPEDINYTLYDLDTKTIVQSGKTKKNKVIRLENTKADYVFIIVP